MKILIIQPNQNFAKSHFSFTINLAYVLAEFGHEVHLVVPLINEAEKLDNKMDEEQFKVTYFMASDELRKAEEEHKKHGAPIGTWGGMGGRQANGTNRNEEGQTEKSAAAKEEEPSAAAAGQQQTHGQRRPTPIFAKLYLEMASNMEFMCRLKAQHYDIGIAEAFMTNEWSLALFRLLGLPRTLFTSAMRPLPEFYYFLGMLGAVKEANIPPLRATRIGDNQADKRTARKEEIWQSYLEAIGKSLVETIDINVAFQCVAQGLYGISQFPLLSELFSQVDAYLVNSQPELDFAEMAMAIHSIPNNKIRYVGGVNALRSREKQNGMSTIDQNILERAAAMPGGMILLSLGTVLDTNKRLGNEQLEAIKQAIGQFPDHLFIWKMSEGDERIGQMNAEMANVYASHWVDQPAILAHPNTVAFISHCGMNSALEAAWNGIPLICLPCMGDQYYNSEALASKGLAVVLDFFSPTAFTGEALANAIQTQIAIGRKGENNKQLEENGLEMEINKISQLGAELRKKNLRAHILAAVIGEEGRKERKLSADN